MRGGACSRGTLHQSAQSVPARPQLETDPSLDEIRKRATNNISNAVACARAKGDWLQGERDFSIGELDEATRSDSEFMSIEPSIVHQGRGASMRVTRYVMVPSSLLNLCGTPGGITTTSPGPMRRLSPF
jgi:hypothetical protein